MRIRVFWSIALCAVLLATISISVDANHYGLQRMHTIKQNGAEFRYIIFDNTVDNDGDPKDAIRTVEVLLDEAAFSETTLKKLFKLVSKRFPKPAWLKVWVYTNLKQLPTPEEDDLPKVSGTDDNPDFDKHHWALLMRVDGNELFRYNSDPPNGTLKTVILKGNDPFGP